MLVQLNAVVHDLDDQPVQDGTTPLTYKKLILTVLNARTDDAMQCFDLLLQLRGKTDVDLNEEDRTFLKQRSNGVLLPLYWGRLNEALSDPPANPDLDV